MSLSHIFNRFNEPRTYPMCTCHCLNACVNSPKLAHPGDCWKCYMCVWGHQQWEGAKPHWLYTLSNQWFLFQNLLTNEGRQCGVSLSKSVLISNLEWEIVIYKHIYLILHTVQCSLCLRVPMSVCTMMWRAALSPASLNIVHHRRHIAIRRQRNNINGLTKASKRPKGICNNGTSRIYRVREIQPTIVIVLRCFWFCSWCCRCTNYHLRAPIQLPLSIGLTEHARTIGSSIDGLFFFLSFSCFLDFVQPNGIYDWFYLWKTDRENMEPIEVTKKIQ